MSTISTGMVMQVMRNVNICKLCGSKYGARTKPFKMHWMRRVKVKQNRAAASNELVSVDVVGYAIIAIAYHCRLPYQKAFK